MFSLDNVKRKQNENRCKENRCCVLNTFPQAHPRVKERDRERQKDKERETERNREKQRETGRNRKRHRETERD